MTQKTTTSPRKSGSGKRQKRHAIAFRLSNAEYDELSLYAQQAELTIGSFIRSRVLKKPTTRQRRRPPMDAAALAKLLAQINRVGGNIHQLVKRINFGATPLDDEIREALTGYREMVDAVMEAMGRKQA
jgi:hypothetical protein